MAEDRLPISQLTRTLTPRTRPVDVRHARALALSYRELPPILVHRETMAVIDGVHRLMAARLLGEESVPIEFFDGSERDGFVAGVRANSGHGKPLSLDERKRAARRILAWSPEWSDRKVAELCWLSARTVAAIRARATGQLPQLSARVGRDGKQRPNDPTLVRLRIAALVERHPDASSRAVAAEVMTSQATVLDVRRRIARGENPLPARLRATAEPAPTIADSGPLPAMDDAALTATKEALQFSQWFDRSSVTNDDVETYFEAVPRSRVYVVADEARRRSTVWQWFATLVEGRARRPVAR
jgi:ParB-like chromosome segregation protein Spo0J